MIVESPMLTDLRPLLFAVGYRMTGSVSEARAIARETLERACRELGDGTPIASPKAYMTGLATQLAIAHLERARAERAAGPWLPEPVLTGGDDGALFALPGDAELAGDLSLAFLMVLEGLTPLERAVFLLREAYGWAFADLAEVVGTSPDDCRRIGAAARRHVIADRPRFDPSAAARASLAGRLLAAAREGDMEGLVAMLAPDAVLLGDGGAFAAPRHGAPAVAAALRDLFAAVAGVEGATFALAEVNGQPGWIGREADGAAVAVLALDVLDGHVLAIRAVADPARLRHLGAYS